MRILALLIVLFSGVAWATTYPEETVHSVSGLTESTLLSPVLEVPTQEATGSFTPVIPSENSILNLNPIGGFYYAKTPLKDFFIEPYPYGGRYAGQVWATFGWWEMFPESGNRNVWGTMASGDRTGFRLPTAGRGTYCGFGDAFLANLEKGVVSPDPISVNVSIQVTFQHSLGAATINTFDVSSIGATNSGGVDIANGGTANFKFRTYGPNGTSLNGPYAKAMLEFYGPAAIQLSGTFSGPHAAAIVTGAFLANRCG
jgi:hypothetical protein